MTDADLAIAAAQAGAAMVRARFGQPPEADRMCEVYVTGLRGQPAHEGAGGLLVSADQETHDALLALTGKQFRGGGL